MLTRVRPLLSVPRFLVTARFAATSVMDSVADVDIDAAGKFKYILLQITDTRTKQQKLIVRGYERCGYHGDIFDEVEPSIEAANCKAECLGGGRIEHQPTELALKIYGYSQGYGKADHSKSADVLRKAYPTYNITWSNEGY